MASWTRKKYKRLAKGFQGKMKNCLRVMVPKVERALKFAYRDRRVRPRLLRTDQILSINAGVKEHNINYSRFICALNNSNINLDRKTLCNLAINEPFSFKAIVDELKIQGKIEEKQKGMSYLEAMSKGLIYNGKLIQGQNYKPSKSEMIIGVRNWENMTEEQRAEVMRN